MQRTNYIHASKRTGLAYRIIKRGMDIAISTLALLFSWPIILYILMYIKRKSPGSAIFRQTRIKKNRRKLKTPGYYYNKRTGECAQDRRNGSNGHATESGLQNEERRRLNPKTYFYCPKTEKIQKCWRKKDIFGAPFKFYKFSTMYPDALKRFSHMYEYKYTGEEIKRLTFKVVNDPRVPEWAEWLRETSLDELPNFINVLRGDMSIVGPRPDIPEMVKYYSDDQRLKLEVKPGITGLAQIKGRGHLNFQDTLKYDIKYIENMSLALDLKIITRTIRAAIRQDGAF